MNFWNFSVKNFYFNDMKLLSEYLLNQQPKIISKSRNAETEIQFPEIMAIKDGNLELEKYKISIY